MHEKNWTERKDCRQTKLFITNPTDNFKKQIINFDRYRTRILTQILTGHANLQRHRHLMGLEDSPTCPKCKEEEETSAHYLMECPHYSTIRHSIFGYHSLKGNDLQSIKLSNIYQFIKQTKRWNDNPQ